MNPFFNQLCVFCASLVILSCQTPGPAIKKKLPTGIVLHTWSLKDMQLQGLQLVNNHVIASSLDVVDIMLLGGTQLSRENVSTSTKRITGFISDHRDNLILRHGLHHVEIYDVIKHQNIARLSCRDIPNAQENCGKTKLIALNPVVVQFVSTKYTPKQIAWVVLDEQSQTRWKWGTPVDTNLLESDVHDGHIYRIAQKDIQVLSLKTSKVIRTIKIPFDVSSPAQRIYDGQRLLFSSSKKDAKTSTIWMVNLDVGETLYTQSFDRVVQRLFVSENAWLIATANQLTAYDKTTFKPLWTIPTKQKLDWTYSAQTKTHLYTKTTTGTLMAFDTRTGKMAWQVDTHVSGPIVVGTRGRVVTTYKHKRQLGLFGAPL